MAFKITPTTKRQKKYMSAVWDFDTDGGTSVVPFTTSVLPKGAVIVDHVIETVKATGSTGTPTLKIKLGSTEITTSGLAYGNYNGPGDCSMPATTNVKILQPEIINFLFSSAVTSGRIAVTIGYFDAGDYVNL